MTKPDHQLPIRRVFIGTIDRVRILGLGEQPDGSGRSMTFQLAEAFDDQDRDLGMDTYCVSFDNGATFYGAVRRWSVNDRSLEIVFDDAASASLGIAGPVYVSIDDPGTSPDELAEALGAIVGSTG